MRAILLAALAALLPAGADAHLTSGTDAAAAGGHWKAVLRGPHGGDDRATEAPEITIPAGLIAVEPVPNPAHAARSGRLAQAAASGDDAGAGAAGHGAAAGSATVGDLTISGAVARASIGNAPTSAAYMTIVTAGEPDRLIAVASPAAQAVELHTSLEEAGVSKMQRVEAIPVAPDAPATLAPGGHHIMMIGLAAPLEEGTTVPLTLTFEKAGEVTLDVPVSRDVAAHAH